MGIDHLSGGVQIVAPGSPDDLSHRVVGSPRSEWVRSEVERCGRCSPPPGKVDDAEKKMAIAAKTVAVCDSRVIQFFGIRVTASARSRIFGTGAT